MSKKPKRSASSGEGGGEETRKKRREPLQTDITKQKQTIGPMPAKIKFFFFSEME